MCVCVCVHMYVYVYKLARIGYRFPIVIAGIAGGCELPDVSARN